MKIRFFDKETGETVPDQKEYRVDFQGWVWFCKRDIDVYKAFSFDWVPALDIGWEIINEETK